MESEAQLNCASAVFVLFFYTLTHVPQEFQSNMQCQYISTVRHEIRQYIRHEIKPHISLSLSILLSPCQDGFQSKLIGCQRA